jgi:hypothetical protein
MTAADGVIIVAAMGVLGTLFSPLVSSWVSMKSKRQEFDFNRHGKDDEQRRAARREAFVERRDCYISLNRTAREYHASLRTRSHAIEADELNRGTDESLLEIRQDYRRCHAEAQMIVSDEVLRLARPVNGKLAEAYGMLRRIEEGSADAGETPAAVRSLLETVWEPLRELRSQMRADLGVSDSADAPETSDHHVAR